MIEEALTQKPVVLPRNEIFPSIDASGFFVVSKNFARVAEDQQVFMIALLLRHLALKEERHFK